MAELDDALAGARGVRVGVADLAGVAEEVLQVLKRNMIGFLSYFCISRKFHQEDYLLHRGSRIINGNIQINDADQAYVMLFRVEETNRLFKQKLATEI